MKFELRPYPLPEVLHFRRPSLPDERGSFFRLFQGEDLHGLGIAPFCPRDIYLTRSKPRALRGIHLQKTPHAYKKVVTCIRGRVLDVIVDLRRQSKSFGAVGAIELSADNPHGLYIPPGFGHGLLTLGDEPSEMLYLVSTVQHKDSEIGVRWDSINFQWPERNPILSSRDQNLPLLEDFLQSERADGR